MRRDWYYLNSQRSLGSVLRWFLALLLIAAGMLAVATFVVVVHMGLR